MRGEGTLLIGNETSTNPVITGDTKVSSRQAILLAMCFSVNAIYGAYLASIGILMLKIGFAFHVDPSVLGKIMSSGFAGSVVGVLVCGPTSDRFGRKIVLVTTGAILTVGLTIFGSSNSVQMIMLSAPLIGAGCAGMQSAASTLCADTLPSRRAAVLNACQIAFAVGAVVGPITVYQVLEKHVSWHGVYYGFSLLALAITAIMAIVKLPVTQSSGQSDNTNSDGESQFENVQRPEKLWQPVFIGLCLAQMLYAGSEVGFFEWMPSYFKSMPGGSRYCGSVVSVFWIAMTVGRVSMCLLLNRFENLKLGMVLVLLGGLGALLTVTVRNPVLALLFVFHTGACFGGVYSTILADAGDRYHRTAMLGSAIGGIAAFSSIGTSTVPWAVGTLAASSNNWNTSLCIIPVSATLCAAVLYAVRQMNRDPGRVSVPLID